jgi:hypothetical protein
MNYTPNKITHLEPNEVFVFGSNEAGRHGQGAARDALKFGAQYGIGYGISGQTFAIPTKDAELRVLPLFRIRQYVKAFLTYADFSESTFLVTPIGCGLAGYQPRDIAPFFRGAPANVIIPQSFAEAMQ